MYVRISEDGLRNLNLDPETDEEEVAQNVVALGMTPQGTVPLERAMGMPMKYLHRHTISAKAIYESELIDQMDQYETRAALAGAAYDFTSNDDILRPLLEVEIIG